MATSNGANGNVPPVAQEKINMDIVTLTRFLTEEQAKHPEATGDFTCVLFHILP
jgi:fructose-1,6-bisphosphatase I